MSAMAVFACAYAALAGTSWHAAVTQRSSDMMIVTTIALGVGMVCALVAWAA